MEISLFLSCALQALFGYGLSDVCVCVCLCARTVYASKYTYREREREREGERVCKILQVPPLITDPADSIFVISCAAHPKISGSGSSLRRCYSFASQRIRKNRAHSSHLINQEEEDEEVPFFLRCKEKRAARRQVVGTCNDSGGNTRSPRAQERNIHKTCVFGKSQLELRFREWDWLIIKKLYAWRH